MRIDQLSIKHDLKIAVADLLCHPTMGRMIAASLRDRIPCRGLCFDTTNSRIGDSVKAALFWQLYESAEIRYVRAFLSSDLDVVELGSSIGVVSSHIRARLSPKRRLICVEADCDLISVIPQNLRLNRLGTNYELVNCAIDYDHDGSTVFFTPGISNTTGKLRSLGARDDAMEVQAITLSTLLSRHAITDYALVADIEGAEAGILLCDSEALLGCRQMVIELHDTQFRGEQRTTHMMCARLTDLGFMLRARRGSVCVFDR
jgi:FkbM family methyltransferase